MSKEQAEKGKEQWQIKPIKDEPIDNASLLGLGEVVETLYKFLHSDNLIAPLAIAVNGERGAGKTTLIRTLRNSLGSNKVTTVLFDAWQYEHMDPTMALFWTISNALGQKPSLSTRLRQFGYRVGNFGYLAVNVLATRYAGMDIETMRKYFDITYKATTTISEKLQKMIFYATGSKKLLVFIDDLDRCSLENMLKILDMIKIFLNISNVVFVVAVDMSKAELAWCWKYAKEGVPSKEGQEYLEEIFQVPTGIPKPSVEQVRDYIRSLIPKMPDDFLDLLSKAGPKNPRNIKRLLNLISLRSNVGVEPTRKLEIAFMWTLLEELIGKEKAIGFYNEAGGQEAFYELVRSMHEIKLEAYAGKIHSSPFSAIHGDDPLMGMSDKDHMTYEYFRICGKIMSGFGEDDPSICKAIAEVADFSNEIYR